MSRAKKATAGTRIARDINLPSGYGGDKIRKYIARRIDATARRAVKEAYIGGLYMGYYSKVRPSLTIENRVAYPQDLNEKYGINL
jgi:hypothetical protein